MITKLKKLLRRIAGHTSNRLNKRGKGDGWGGKGWEEDEAMDEWQIVEEVSLTIPASGWSRNAKEKSVNTVVVRIKSPIVFVYYSWYSCFSCFSVSEWEYHFFNIWK